MGVLDDTWSYSDSRVDGYYLCSKILESQRERYLGTDQDDSG